MYDPMYVEPRSKDDTSEGEGINGVWLKVDARSLRVQASTSEGWMGPGGGLGQGLGPLPRISRLLLLAHVQRP